ncbi:MAG: SRPBCC domain-containing protein, partial [Desulfococcaceae bacterium]
MVIQEAIDIHAPLPVVWRVFSEMEDWESWNTVCENCCLIEGDEMALGTCFRFTLRPYRIPIQIAPKIVKCDPGKEVIWAGSRWGVHAEHSFTFEEKDGKVILTSIEAFGGPMFWASWLALIPIRLHRLTRQMLKAVKTKAESCLE